MRDRICLFFKTQFNAKVDKSESELAASPQLQMLFLHDRKDPLTKAEPVEESQKILQRAGVNAVIQWHDEGHALGTQSVGLLAQWLKDISDQ